MYMRNFKVFNFDRLSQHHNVVRLKDLVGSGKWDAKLDAVVYFEDKYLPQIKTAIALNVTDNGADYIKLKAFNCSKGELAAMVKKLEPYEHVGIITYEHVVKDAGHGMKLYKTGNACHDEFLQVTPALTKSKQIIQLAKDFREKRLGNQSYIAVHIRPYPDPCLYVWRHPEVEADEKMARNMCKNPGLSKVFVDQTVHAMKEKKKKKQKRINGLFVMSYPSIRTRITEMYRAVGLEPTFLEGDDLDAMMGYTSVSLLGLVEEEIAVEADVFIGTSYSSMTGFISQVRTAKYGTTLVQRRHVGVKIEVGIEVVVVAGALFSRHSVKSLINLHQDE
ncbi:hypothetical protein VOLCADRAFT_91429 [Volvox carteri f. nagariensis]|uniref:O-fucosyltransferase family protein n=1 Tax=Volvox carteri f. nagariensis TaxID=3068 RepID=D8TX22_VOLCA|nr:uncharacterized protein VOLCADRAFT_91429 [Volvox carteri f. nagariensis]EFJ47933.1 hypothetical protein VOLCADRAFT_91429 [Volvox carteri f. nagariensis]|eukprot:XP_002951039.1 hypothetical protein VOLCADRAFT_91429 [Volvox carteri f. nagariensis]